MSAMWAHDLEGATHPCLCCMRKAIKSDTGATVTPRRQGVNRETIMASSGALYLMRESVRNKTTDVPLLLEMINKSVPLLNHPTRVFRTGGPFVEQGGKHGRLLYVYITKEEKVLNAQGQMKLLFYYRCSVTVHL